MASVLFDNTVGGDGSTVSDDSNPTTGLANDGHRTRLVPALANIVAIALWVKAQATTVLGYRDAASTSASNAAVSAAASSGSGPGPPCS